MAEAEFRVLNTYEEWLKSEGIPVVRGFHVEDVNSLDLAPWPRKGGLGAHINIEGSGGLTDAYVCEIPPGKSLLPQRHLFDEVIYILGGTGATSVWNDEAHKQTFEWGPSSLFAVPLNAWHQHFNGSGTSPARYMAVTNAPRMMNLFHNLDFILSNPFVFDDRFTAEEDYWTSAGAKGRIGPRKVWETNFVPDLMSLIVPDRPGRGPVGRQHFVMGRSIMGIHVAEHPPGTYAKAHRHGPGVHILTLAGRGYTLLWKEGEQSIKLPWKPGELFGPPDGWFHQHFNTSNIPERSLRIGGSGRRYASEEERRYKSDLSMREGGDQIEYEDEDPEIRREFERELAKAGVKSAMPPLEKSR